jgi:hypothetical protein
MIYQNILHVFQVIVLGSQGIISLISKITLSFIQKEKNTSIELMALSPILSTQSFHMY